MDKATDISLQDRNITLLDHIAHGASEAVSGEARQPQPQRLQSSSWDMERGCWVGEKP